jgi:hypothetical protein
MLEKVEIVPANAPAAVGAAGHIDLPVLSRNVIP